MIKAGIIGGAGYTAGELIRLLLNHPETEIVFINSSSNAGNKITDVHEGLVRRNRSDDSPTSYLWTKSTFFSSVLPTATRRNSWKATTYRKT